MACSLKSIQSFILSSICRRYSLYFGPTPSGFFSELNYRIFLIFCMKLKANKGQKVTEPDFSGKFWFCQFGAKRAKNYPKIWFLHFNKKLSHEMFVRSVPKIKHIMILYHSLETACLGKIWFSSY